MLPSFEMATAHAITSALRGHQSPRTTEAASYIDDRLGAQAPRDDQEPPARSSHPGGAPDLPGQRPHQSLGQRRPKEFYRRSTRRCPQTIKPWKYLQSSGWSGSKNRVALSWVDL